MDDRDFYSYMNEEKGTVLGETDAAINGVGRGSGKAPGMSVFKPYASSIVWILLNILFYAGLCLWQLVELLIQ